MARPDLNRGDRVCVREPGIGSWLGTVIAVKYSKASGWYVDVRRAGGATWVVPAELVTKERMSVDA